ncbi:Fasciclin domain protein [Cesiribacter andamanensis AMV16]|uniref:Fasciclin domain protein n=2 Tax=Cesiribacter TaxID=1133570 RepID=M7NV59_9BACT|nr:Fasciclin domain protein [Cesiribacter andamanensis AMV16]
MLIALLLGWGCDATNENRPIDPTQTLLQRVRDQSELSSFYTALERLNLLSTLQNQHLDFTLLAPTNAAFASYLQAAGYTSLEAVPLSALDPLIRYHIALGNKPVAQLDSSLLSTLSGSKIVAYTSNNTVLLNQGTALATTDLRATNGVLHTLGEVLQPPTQSLADLIATRASGQEAEYGLLQAALTHTGLASVLDNANQRLTLFAPTDAAFTAAGYTTVEEIEQEDPAVIRPLLLYHLLAGYRFSHMLHTGNLRTQLGDSVRVDATAGTLLGEGNTQPARLLPAEMDQFTTNGVLHGIDAVLLPD